MRDKSCNNKFSSKNIYKKSLITLFLSVIIIIIQFTTSYSNFTELLLTNSSTQHTMQVMGIKFNDDYSYVYSLSKQGDIKVWKFNLPSIQLTQTITVTGCISYIYYDSFFVWKNGTKIFFGRCSKVYQYLFNNSTSIYSLSGVSTPALTSNNILGIWVSNDGNRIYLATEAGSIRFTWNGSAWIQNTPGIITSTINLNKTTFVTCLNNQQKIIVLDYDSGNLFVFKLNSSTLSHQLHQTIPIGAGSLRCCVLSSNQQFITCYGSVANAQFGAYILNNSTDLYTDVSKPDNNSFYSYYNYMNPNNLYTTANRYYDTVYKYHFNIQANGSFSYTFLFSYTFPDRPHRIAYQRSDSQFQIYGLMDGSLYLLYRLCNNTSFLPHCVTCQPINTKCNKCSDGYDLQFDRCDNCLPGYYPNGTICSSCGINCQNCSSLTNCSIFQRLIVWVK